jgi:hypothetical protein
MLAKDSIDMEAGLLEGKRNKSEEELKLSVGIGRVKSQMYSLESRFRFDFLLGVKVLLSLLPFICKPDRSQVPATVSFASADNIWIRRNQQLYNRAVWETVLPYLPRIRAELVKKREQIFTAPQRTFDTVDQLNKLAEVEREFFIENPDRAWIGDEP